MENIISFDKIGLTFNLSRTAFSLFGVDIYWYAIIIVTGLVVAFIYAINEAKKCDVSQDDLLNMFIIAVPCSIIGARLYYVLFSLDSFKNNLSEIFNIRGGGLAIYGGVIGAFLTVYLYSRKKKLHFGNILDILAVGLLIGQCIGRWGNFVNGEAFGRETNSFLSMTVISDGKMIARGVHPTFLYESLWNLLGLILILIHKKRKVFSGELFSMYLTWYGLGRMLIEGLRTDSLMIGTVRVSQMLSLILFIIGIILIIRGRKKKKLN